MWRGHAPLMLYVLALMAGAVAWGEGIPVTATVARVIDGDTVALDSGLRVRLLDINAPELAHDGAEAEPYGPAAAAGLRAMIEGKPVTLETGNTPKDRYGRVLAHLFTPDGGWVNGGMVAAGLAHVYTFPDNALYGPQLEALEATARAEQKGFWRLPRWRVRDAATCCADEDVGRFILVRGTVRQVAVLGSRGKDQRVYLNFGDDYRTDLSAEIRGRDVRAFEAAGITDFNAAYAGKTVLIRGIAMPVNGTLIRLTHSGQIAIVKD